MFELDAYSHKLIVFTWLSTIFNVFHLKHVECIWQEPTKHRTDSSAWMFVHQINKAMEENKH